MNPGLFFSASYKKEVGMATLLEVKGLKTRFFTQDGVVHAVNGISYHVDEGETLAIVGESGCGKSVSVLSVMRLIPTPPGEIVEGEVWFEGRDLMKVDQEEIRSVRGNKIAMIFQDPMTSMSPDHRAAGRRSSRIAYGHGQETGQTTQHRASGDGEHPLSRRPP